MLAFPVTYVALHTVCFPLVASGSRIFGHRNKRITIVRNAGGYPVHWSGNVGDLSLKCQAQAIHVSHKTITKGDDQSLGITKKTRIL